MSPKLETFLRSFGSMLVFVVLAYLSDATHLTDLLGPALAALVSALAAAGVAAYDKTKSPDGTVAFGAIGKEI